MENRRDLSSWKEIADYFGVSVRTVQHWEEERGLPVRRLPGGGRGRVFASLSELEEWKRACALLPGDGDGGPGDEPAGQDDTDSLTGAPPSPGLTAPVKTSLTARSVLLAVLRIALILAVAAPAAYLYFRRGRPTHWRVENDTLIVLDARNHELWRKAFNKPLEPAAYSPESNNGPLPRLIDIDTDGDAEMLFPYRPKDRGDTGILICYSSRGMEKWRFVPGGAVRSQDGNFDATFDVRNFALVTRGTDHEKALLVVSTHNLFYPTQVALLSASGVLLRQYWHSGHIGGGSDTLRITDFDHDGRDAIYLCGVSNGYRQATLVVLDPDTFEGAASEVDGEHQLQGFPPGKELARILFPRGCMNRISHEYNNALAMNFTDKSLVVHVSELVGATPRQDVHVFYNLGPDLSLRGFEVGDRFESMHEQLHREGKLDHAFSPAELLAFHKLTYLSHPPSATSDSPQTPR
jgi:MerR HTH family regulatory protein